MSNEQFTASVYGSACKSEIAAIRAQNSELMEALFFIEGMLESQIFHGKDAEDFGYGTPAILEAVRASLSEAQS